MKIVNLGSLNVDHVYWVDRFLMPGETKASKGLNDNAGGKGLNQSIAAARTGSAGKENRRPSWKNRLPHRAHRHIRLLRASSLLGSLRQVRRSWSIPRVRAPRRSWETPIPSAAARYSSTAPARAENPWSMNSRRDSSRVHAGSSKANFGSQGG